MRTILRRVQVDWGVRKTGELLDLAKVLYHWTKRDFPPLLTQSSTIWSPSFSGHLPEINNPFRLQEVERSGVHPEGTTLANSEMSGGNDISLIYPWLHISARLPWSCWWWWWWRSLWPFSPSLPDISVWLAKHSETASVQERPKTHLRAMSENALEKYHHHNCPHRQHQYVKGPGPLQASGSGNISDRRECSSLTGDGKTHIFFMKND